MSSQNREWGVLTFQTPPSCVDNSKDDLEYKFARWLVRWIEGAFRKILEASQLKFQCWVYHQHAVRHGSNLLSKEGDSWVLSCSNNLCAQHAVRCLCGQQLPSQESSLLYSFSILQQTCIILSYQLGPRQKSYTSNAVYCLTHWAEKRHRCTLRNLPLQNSHTLWRQLSSMVKT